MGNMCNRVSKKTNENMLVFERGHDKRASRKKSSILVDINNLPGTPSISEVNSICQAFQP